MFHTEIYGILRFDGRIFQKSRYSGKALFIFPGEEHRSPFDQLYVGYTHIANPKIIYKNILDLLFGDKQ